MKQVAGLFAEGQFRAAGGPLAKGDGHLDHVLPVVPDDQLQGDLVADGPQSLDVHLVASHAEETRHHVADRRQRPGQPAPDATDQSAMGRPVEVYPAAGYEPTADGHAHPGVVHGRQQGGDSFRRMRQVGIHDDAQTAARLAQATHDGRRQPALPVPHDAAHRPAPSQVGRHPGGFIGRVIVHDNQFAVVRAEDGEDAFDK